MSKTEALDWFSKSERGVFQSRMLITYDIKLPSKCTEMWHKLTKLPIKNRCVRVCKLANSWKSHVEHVKAF